MRTRTEGALFMIVLSGSAALLGALGVGCAPQASRKPATTASETEPSASLARGSAGAPAPEAPEQRVKIDNFTFNPRSLSVAPGTKVTWINQDDVPHTATSSDEPRRFNSGALDTDDSFSFTFKERGTYAYFCAIHPHMTGEVIVK